MNKLTAEQIKGRIKNIAKENDADARVLIRLFMMEKLLERLSVSEYKDNVIIKGGMLVTSMIGISMRSTLDIDATIRNINLSPEDIEGMMKNIIGIDLDDNISFEIKEVSTIMDEMDYPGVRVTLEARIERISVPIKVDVSTGDVITPREVRYEYKTLLDEKNIPIWTYNIETLLAEKVQTILARGILNTRMRDYYDVYALRKRYEKSIDYDILKTAFSETCRKRGTVELLKQNIIEKIENDKILQDRWNSYKEKYSYAGEITYMMIIEELKKIIEKL